jgi:N-formylglutamate deformylase
MSADRSPFEIHRPDGRDHPIVVHVPHAGTRLPPAVRAGIVLDDDELALEVLRLTDHRTDVLAAGTASHGATRFVNWLSRLVVDPERFPDDREPLAARGMGAVYTLGHRRQPLRPVPTPDEAELLARYFHPYAEALAALVSERLGTHGRCTIVDLHSYPARRLPYELGTGPRPPLCIGTDPVHTPGWLTELVVGVAARHGIDAAFDTPFAGTYVPLDHHGSDDRVTSVMLELRRDLYLDEDTGTPHRGESEVAAFVTDVAAALAAHQAAD